MDVMKPAYLCLPLSVSLVIGKSNKNRHVLLCFFSLDIFEKALNAGFIQAMDYVEIWQAYLDYLRRRVDFTQGNCI